jgi:hypothetical protein
MPLTSWGAGSRLIAANDCCNLASFKASALVQRNNGNCGKFSPGEPIIGSAKFTRTAN